MGTKGQQPMRRVDFWVGAVAVIVAGFALTRLVENPRDYLAGYIVLQYVVLAQPGYLGGYARYVNYSPLATIKAPALAVAILNRRCGTLARFWCGHRLPEPGAARNLLRHRHRLGRTRPFIADLRGTTIRARQASSKKW